MGPLKVKVIEIEERRPKVSEPYLGGSLAFKCTMEEYPDKVAFFYVTSATPIDRIKQLYEVFGLSHKPTSSDMKEFLNKEATLKLYENEYNNKIYLSLRWW